MGWVPLSLPSRLPPKGTEEGQFIDFKESGYGNGDKDRLEIARDVAQFANAMGGTILVGAREDGFDRLEEYVALPDARVQETRILQVCTSALSPRPVVAALRLRIGEEGEIVAVNIDPFPGTVGVRVASTERWEFPIRDGKTRRFWRFDEVEMVRSEDRRVRLMFEAISELSSAEFSVDCELRNIQPDGWRVAELNDSHVVFSAPNGKVSTVVPYAFVTAIWPTGVQRRYRISLRCQITSGANENVVSQWRR